MTTTKSTQLENARLRRAKKINVATSTASGALGIGALGALGARYGGARLMSSGAKHAKRGAKMKRMGDQATVPLSAASLGVGGIGSLNFARVQNQEANRLPRLKDLTERQRNAVVKSYGLDMGGYVHQGDGVSKAFYDPEGARRKRLDVYQTAAAAGAGATGVTAIKPARDTVSALRAAKEGNAKKLLASALAFEGKLNQGAAKTKYAAGARRMSQGLAAARKSGTKAGALGASAIGLAIGSDQIRRYKNGRGRSYTPREW